MEIKKYEHQHRAFIKIEDGCNNFCSYCIIPYVRGRVRSKDFNKCIIEVNDLALSGHKEIVLSGIHTGQYSSNNKRLSDLINEISKVEQIKRIRLSSVEIVELDDKFELPTNSILHIADNFAHPNSLSDLPDVEHNIFIQREHFLRYIYHDAELQLDGPLTYEDKYIYRIAGLPSKLMKFKSTYRRIAL